MKFLRQASRKFSIGSWCLFFILFLSINHCKSVDKKDDIVKKEDTSEGKQDKKEEGQNGLKNAKAAEIFAEPVKEAEVFRVVVSSDGYDRKQLANLDEINVKDDQVGDSYLTQELEKYNKIDFKTEAVLKLELFPDSGLISRVRFKKPSQITELDKLLSEDVTRWVFEFKNKIISPRIFHITYVVLLKKKISREEALKILQEKVEKK